MIWFWRTDKKITNTLIQNVIFLNNPTIYMEAQKTPSSRSNVTKGQSWGTTIADLKESHGAGEAKQQALACNRYRNPQNRSKISEAEAYLSQLILGKTPETHWTKESLLNRECSKSSISTCRRLKIGPQCMTWRSTKPTQICQRS